MSLLANLTGWLGEVRLARGARKALDKIVYRTLNDVILHSASGTTQIDHIVFSRYGIFVIETKNIKGWIFGAATDPKWTQSLYRKTFTFQNPLHQNFRHIKVLEELLGLPVSRFHSVVCFVSKRCTFKTAMPPNVIHGEPASYIRSRTLELLSEAEVGRAFDTVASAMGPRGWLGGSSSHAKREHRASLEARYASKTACPKCGAPLVTRTSRKRGAVSEVFYGCQRYPSCRYTRPLS